MSFAPINQIHQCLHAFHFPSHDRTQVVEAFHYCSHVDPKMFQCLIYDSQEKNAKLIGIEYVIHEDLFVDLPADEKKYWHSHKHEVGSGLLVALGMGGALGTAVEAAKAVPGVGSSGGVPDNLERMPMEELYKTYGKTFHLWHPASQRLPLGPPVLMMSTTESHPGPPGNYLRERDQKYGIDTSAKGAHRATYLDPDYKVKEGADDWEKTGIARRLVPKDETFKQEDGSQSKAKGGA